MFPILSFHRFLSNYSKILTSDKGKIFLQKITDFVNEPEKFPSTSLKSYGNRNCHEIASKHALLQEKWEETEILSSLKKEGKNDKKLLVQIDKDTKGIETFIDELCEELAYLIIRDNEFDDIASCQMEFSSGVGGLESGLFASELYSMYENYAARRGWSWNPIKVDFFDGSNAIRYATVSLHGPRVYTSMKFEAGVHRVQRNPVTDPSRIHTSTMSIVVMPESSEDPEIAFKKGELKIEFMRASGPGGQNVNKTNSAVRIVHLPTGIQVHAQEDRFQYNNLKIAKQKLMSKLLQIQVDEQAKASKATRQLQATTKSWSEKIRTFNYKSSRVTDHRINYETRRLDDFLRGGDSLDELIRQLEELHMVERLEDAIEQELSS